MNPRWRNLLILLIIIAIVAYAFFSMPPAQVQPKFDDSYFELLLSGNGLTPNDLSSVLSSFSENFSGETAASLQQGLGRVPEDNSASAAFAGILEEAISLDQKQLAIAEEFDSLLDSDMAGFCTSMDAWGLKEDESSSLVAEAIELEDSLETFYQRNPDYKSLGFAIDTESLSQEQVNLAHSLYRLEDACIIAVYSFDGLAIEVSEE